jgi:hypothetical protein
MGANQARPNNPGPLARVWAVSNLDFCTKLHYNMYVQSKSNAPWLRDPGVLVRQQERSVWR